MSVRHSVRVGLLAGAALAILTGAAAAQQAQDGSGGPDAVSLTIYNQNVALVEDTRALDIPAGRSRREFPGVSASIRPETVGLSGRGLSVVEQNFDYDLLTPDRLMQAAVGGEIGIVRTIPGTGAQQTERARVLAANEGVVLEVDGRIEVLRDDGVPTRVIFDEVPTNLRSRPTLSVTLDAEGGGRRDVTLNYLTTGLAWKADYVARYDEAAGTLDLTGWVTINNQSGATFSNARTRVVAGDVSVLNAPNTSSSRGYAPPAPRGAGTQAGTARGLADVYVYPLPEPVTVANNQTKQVGLLAVSGLPATKTYLFQSNYLDTWPEPGGAQAGVRFSNGAESGMGQPLPGGIIRVYVDDASGEPRFIGENRVNHTPAGSTIVVATGAAFDVTVQPRVVQQETIQRRGQPNATRYRMEYTVRNARRQPVTVEVRQNELGGTIELSDQSIEGERRGQTVRWQVPVPANGQTVLTATLLVAD